VDGRQILCGNTIFCWCSVVSNEGFVRNFIVPIDRVGHFFEVMSVMFREL
jgi:hypothetical protein